MGLRINKRFSFCLSNKIWKRSRNHRDLEIRYRLNRFVRSDTPGSQIITDEIKNIAVIKDGKYLHWSNLLGYMESYDDGPYWEMETSIDLKEIIQLLLDTTIANNEEEFEPNEKTEDYFTVDLFTRIKKYGKIYFDLPFFNKKKDVYEGFIEKLSEGKYLFSDYAKLSPEEKIKLSKIEKEVTQLRCAYSQKHFPLHLQKSLPCCY